ncbi:unnamed protein product, partial [marine sediment metagenome]
MGIGPISITPYAGYMLEKSNIDITTKHPYSPRMEITKENVIKRLEASLKRMQTDYIDIALVHQ